MVYILEICIQGPRPHVWRLVILGTLSLFKFAFFNDQKLTTTSRDSKYVECVECVACHMPCHVSGVMCNKYKKAGFFLKEQVAKGCSKLVAEMEKNVQACKQHLCKIFLSFDKICANFYAVLLRK